MLSSTECNRTVQYTYFCTGTFSKWSNFNNEQSLKLVAGRSFGPFRNRTNIMLNQTRKNSFQQSFKAKSVNHL